MLTNQPVANTDEALIAAQRLMDKGCKQHVLITLGKNGALLLSRNGNDGFLEPLIVKAPEVKAIDTTVYYYFLTSLIVEANCCMFELLLFRVLETAF